MIFSTMFVLYLLFNFYYALELYILAYNFILRFGKYLLIKLICYFVYNAHFFLFQNPCYIVC